MVCILSPSFLQQPIGVAAGLCCRFYSSEHPTSLQVFVAQVEPWQDDLYMPAIARPSSRQPPAAPEKLSRREPARDLAQRVLLGSVDMRLWVIQRSEEDESSGGVDEFQVGCLHNELI